MFTYIGDGGSAPELVHLRSEQATVVIDTTEGKQARDMLHPWDIFRMIQMQIEKPWKKVNKVMNLGGGKDNTYSLAELDAFCKKHITNDKVINRIADNRSFDIPLYISDYSLAQKEWGWAPSINAEKILNEILHYGKNNCEHLKRIS